MAISLINTDKGGASAAAGTIATAGIVHRPHSLLVACIVGFASETVTSVTNTALDQWYPCSGAYIQNAAPGFADIWYTASSKGNAADIVTGHYSDSLTTFRSILVLEYIGASVEPFETATNGTTSSSSASITVTSGSFTPSAAGNVNVTVANQSQGGTWGAGTNYAIEITETTNNVTSQDRQNAPSGAQTASENITGSTGTNVLILAVASFKAFIPVGLVGISSVGY